MQRSGGADQSVGRGRAGQGKTGRVRDGCRGQMRLPTGPVAIVPSTVPVIVAGMRSVPCCSQSRVPCTWAGVTTTVTSVYTPEHGVGNIASFVA